MGIHLPWRSETSLFIDANIAAKGSIKSEAPIPTAPPRQNMTRGEMMAKQVTTTSAVDKEALKMKEEVR